MQSPLQGAGEVSRLSFVANSATSWLQPDEQAHFRQQGLLINSISLSWQEPPQKLILKGAKKIKYTVAALTLKVNNSINLINKSIHATLSYHLRSDLLCLEQ